MSNEKRNVDKMKSASSPDDSMIVSIAQDEVEVLPSSEESADDQCTSSEQEETNRVKIKKLIVQRLSTLKQSESKIDSEGVKETIVMSDEEVETVIQDALRKRVKRLISDY